MVKINILIEQAIGYGLIKSKYCKSVDELLSCLKERKVSKLTSDFELVEFQPFSSAANAAFNCVDIANGVVSKDLEKLLRNHLATEKSILVVNDKRLLESLKALNINSELTFSADNNIIFYLRDIRHNFHLFLNDSQDHIVKAHIGLGHGYSRIKIKYNVNRSDNMIIQAINLLDQMDKDINTVSMRIREWFGYHYPELFKIVPDYKMYAKIASLIESRAGAIQANFDKIEEILQDSSKAQMIIESAKTSMGYELSAEDFLNIKLFSDKLIMMIAERENTAKYLNTKMNQVAPNFSTLVGDIVAARLISHAGSLINLAKFPASTIQILGAEKALFRAIKTRGNTPKYGLIFHSSFIGRAAKGDKGRISRFLAAKISLAVRLDCFMDEPINIYGLHLKKHVEDQLVYLETGKEPQKNFEMMEAAVKDAKEFVANLKLNSKNKNEETEEMKMEQIEIKNEPENFNSEKKKKKKKSIITEEVKEEMEVVKSEETTEQSEKKKKKKKRTSEGKIKTEETVKTEAEVGTISEKKKKKKSIIEGEIKVEALKAEEVETNSIEKSEKKKKSKKSKTEGELKLEVTKTEEVENNSLESSEKKKKSKKSKTGVEVNGETVKTEEVAVEISEKKKKKAKKSKLEEIENAESSEPQKKKKKTNN